MGYWLVHASFSLEFHPSIHPSIHPFIVKQSKRIRTVKKYVHLRGLTYIHTCRSYVHTPRDHVFGTREPKGNRCERREVVVARSPIRPVVGFWGSKVHQNVRFPALDTDEPPCKI